MALLKDATSYDALVDDPLLQKTERFTVKSDAKIDIIKEKKKKSKETTTCLAVLKWISTIFLFCATLFCLVASKISLISIAQHMVKGSFHHNQTMIDEHVKKGYQPDTAFVMVILILIIPEFISFLRALPSAFSTKELWPKKSTCIIFGLGGALLECLGLSMFTIVLISTTQDFTLSILCMNGVFIVPAFFLILSERRKMTKKDGNNSQTNDSHMAFSNEVLLSKSQSKSSRRYMNLVGYFVAFISAIAGFVYIMLKLVKITAILEGVIIAISILFLSIAWSPPFLKKQTNVKDKDRFQVDSYSGDGGQNMRMRNARQKMTLLSSIFKLVIYIPIALLVTFVFNTTSFSNPGESLKNGFQFFTKNTKLVNAFTAQVITSFLGYVCAWLACTMNLQKMCFVSSLFLSTPVSFVFVHFGKGTCGDIFGFPCDSDIKTFTLMGALLCVSQLLLLFLNFFKPQPFLMAGEDLLFWLPTYNGCLLEQQLLVNRKNEVTDEYFIDYHEIVKETHVYLCTTMYHEADHEMEQLLRSLAKIDEARKECKRQFEAHIWMDDGARDDVVKWYALQLLSLVKDTLGIDPGDAFKLETPYGLQLKWSCPNGMPFILHLKDKVKVKSKKRWSQVMYMSYVLDFKETKDRDDLTYILATDADVEFKAKDVMALMDYMSRNPNVGAVCGRTHPKGVGPMVWYQIFDYAVGHWLLKVANHVFGSVLCSPGCFSVYRSKAIRDVLPLYASGVEHAMDFLMKDMGEDRWFCTLLVEAGWKLEYCATAVDITYCPETFDEFFKQRRRWGPSTLANSLKVLEKQKSMRENNDAITAFFIAYQFILMLSTVIGPSTVLLVIAGGLQYAFPYSVNMVVVVILLVIVTIIFTMVCLYCKQDTQLQVAKLLTFFFAIIMSITIVGIILQTVDDVGNFTSPPTKTPPTTPRHYNFNVTLPPLNYTTEYIKNPYIFSPATWYLLTLTVLFIFSAFLHGLEGFYLIHGIWYLLCLPSGYLLLTIYSVANLTDRSWGTREGKTKTEDVDISFTERLGKWFSYFCWCCVPPHLREKPSADEKATNNDKEDGFSNENDDSRRGSISSESERSNSPDVTDGQLIDIPSDTVPEVRVDGVNDEVITKKPLKGLLKKGSSTDHLDKIDGKTGARFRFPGQAKGVHFAPSRPRLHSATTIQEWLGANAPRDYQKYVENFVSNGYDNVSFIAGNMKEKDLMSIGIENRGHRKKLVMLIDMLPPEDLFEEVPENVEEWLINIGLEEYWPTFSTNSYTESRDLADIKYMSRTDVSTLFEITKEGHLKRLLMATSVLQYPSKVQTRIRETRKAVMREPPKNLETDNADDGDEFEFWKELRDICLLPEQAAFNKSGELVEKLGDLRDTCLLVLAVANVLWLTFMITIMEQGTKLNVLGSPFASVAFLMIYGLVLIFQFISLLWHRLETLIHFIARAPFKRGHFKSNWAWRDADLPQAPDPKVLEEIRRRRRLNSTGSNSSSTDGGVTAPLIRSRSYNE